MRKVAAGATVVAVCAAGGLLFRLWKFIPSNYDHLGFGYVKNLFLIRYRNRNHIVVLFDQNTKSFSFDKSWKNCFMLGSRSLTIAWGDDARYWSWIAVPESRFPQNAKLESVCWLHVKGVLPAKLLSKNTSYGAYFVFKLTSDRTGFRNPIQASLSEVDEHGLPLVNGQTMSTNSVYLDPSEEDADSEKDIIVPIEREDGWMEIEMGTYQVGLTTSETAFLEMNLRETKVLNWKSSLLIHGIELRSLMNYS